MFTIISICISWFLKTNVITQLISILLLKNSIMHNKNWKLIMENRVFFNFYLHITKDWIKMALFLEKIFYKAVLNPLIRISPLADYLSALPWEHWIKKMVNYLSCIEGKRVWKAFAVLLNFAQQFIFYDDISIIFRQSKQ